MELITILFLILFLVAIPWILIVIFGEQYGSNPNTSNALLKFVLSFLVYAALSAFTLFFLLFVYIGPDPKPGYKTPFENKIAGLIAVFVYGFIGWLLCSFIKGKLIEPWLIFRFKKESPPSIFDSK